MGPKKKAGKASKGSRGSGGIIDGVPMTEMPREHLEKYTMRIKDELEREREERNFYQLERDKLKTFWEITRQQLEENKAELRNKDRALEEAEEKHQNELKEYNERVKHLVYEHQSHLTEVKAENMVALRMAQEEHRKQETLLIEEKEELLKKIVDEELSHEEKVRQIYMDHSEKIYRIREEFLEKIKEMAIKAEKRAHQIREYYTLKNKMELMQIEESKNDIIHKLDGNHKTALKELKTYYCEIIDNNLALIEAMKEEMTELKTKKDDLQRTANKYFEENKSILEPLENYKKRVEGVEKELTDFKKTKTSLANISRRYAKLKEEAEELGLAKESLEVSLDKKESELESLKLRYSTALSTIQTRNSLSVQCLQKKILELEEEADQKEVVTAQIISKAGASLEPEVVHEANRKIQVIMDKKMRRLEKLESELCKAVAAHDLLLNEITNVAEQYNLPGKLLLGRKLLRPQVMPILAERLTERDIP